jgi:hypothetical protein
MRGKPAAAQGRIGVHGRPLSMNRWNISVQSVAFLCNKWGVWFAQQLAHKQYGGM